MSFEYVVEGNEASVLAWPRNEHLWLRKVAVAEILL